MSSTRFHNKNILITGGSSGIGLATAIEFGHMGAHLFLLARRQEPLEKAQEQIQGICAIPLSIEIFSVDVSNQEQVEKTISHIAHEYGGIDVLINNAGIIEIGRFTDLTINQLEKVLHINYLGMVYMVKACWPFLEKSTVGHIGFVSSVAGYVGIIGYSAYAPSKFAITGLAECLRQEAQDAGIGITILFPPDTDTPQLAYEKSHRLPEINALNGQVKELSPERVAQKFVKGIERKRFEVYCNGESRWLRVFKGTFPKVYYYVMNRVIINHRKKGSLP